MEGDGTGWDEGSKYEEIPLGRVFFDEKKILYKAYSSTRLIKTTKEFRELVLKTFCLPTSVTVLEIDLHYEPPDSIVCNR